jgi:hypothetical protein
MTAGLRLVSGWLGTMEHLSGTGVLDAEALMDEVLGDTGQIASTLETLEEPLARLLEAVEAEADLSALGAWVRTGQQARPDGRACCHHEPLPSQG